MVDRAKGPLPSLESGSDPEALCKAERTFLRFRGKVLWLLSYAWYALVYYALGTRFTVLSVEAFYDSRHTPA